MRRVPILSGSRVLVVPVEDGDVVLRAPPPPSRAVDTAAAVRDALRFPLAGAPLSALVPRGGRATIVVEPPRLPLPGAPLDPRQEALAAVIDELATCGIGDERQTILVAGGLGRRLGPGELDWLLPAPRARTFRGRVLVHDASDPELVPIAESARHTIRSHPALLATDLVAVCSSAETVLHGGPATLLAACDAETIRRAAAADSLLQASGAPEWADALTVESALGSRVAIASVSLVLDHPRLTGRFRDYPHEDASLAHLLDSPFRRVFSLLPGSARRTIVDGLGRRIGATAAYAGPPSVAHAEALLRGIELRGTRVAEPLDALVVGVPWIGSDFPREPLNPLTSAALALGLALRLWRDAFPLRPGGTLVLVHSLTRTFARGTQDPYQSLFGVLRSGDPADLAAGERDAAVDEDARSAYRSGRACHPLGPYAEWAGCQPALARLGRVIVAGSRDAVAARRLGLVPTRSVASALEMVHGVTGGRARVGVLVAPPYPPLLVG